MPLLHIKIFLNFSTASYELRVRSCDLLWRCELWVIFAGHFCKLRVASSSQLLNCELLKKKNLIFKTTSYQTFFWLKPCNCNGLIALKHCSPKVHYIWVLSSYIFLIEENWKRWSCSCNDCSSTAAVEFETMVKNSINTTNSTGFCTRNYFLVNFLR